MKDLLINGIKDLSVGAFDGNRIYLKESMLREGELNEVTISFWNRYSLDGNGLGSYTDSTGEQYLSVFTEPYAGNRICPLIDQPDLRGTFEVYATVEEDWIVITGEILKYECKCSEFISQNIEIEECKSFIKLIKERHSSDFETSGKFFIYRRSKSIPSYLNSICAGPYEKISLSKEKLHNNIEMSIYCRRALARYALIQSEDMFENQIKALRYFEDFFCYEYPFEKCDAVYCPNFPVLGGMEYPGAISYSEDAFILPKEKYSKAEISLRARVFFHEIAHMWFGNIVSIKWWDGTWLKESFADFCCYTAWEEVRPTLTFPLASGWVYFLIRKIWAFKDDQQPRTTHPVSTHVPNTDIAASIYDGITYPKGAAVLRQLMELISKETFSSAMKIYFHRFAWSCADIDDLLDCCKEVLGEQDHPYLDLKQWKEDWLQTPGINELTPFWSPNTVTGILRIRQTASMKGHPKLRFHKISIGLFGKSGKLLKEQIAILNNSEWTDIEYNLENEELEAIFVNYRDWTYAKINFDDKSLEYFREYFECLDILGKCLYLRSIYDCTRDARMKPSKFFMIVESLLAGVNDDADFISFSTFFINDILQNYLLDAKFSEQSSVLFNITLDKLRNPNINFDMVCGLKEALLTYAFSKSDLTCLIEMLKEKIEGISHLLNISEKWRVVYLYCSSQEFSEESKDALIQFLSNKDDSELKYSYLPKISAVRARGVERDEIFRSFVDCTTTFISQRSLMESFTSRFQPTALLTDYFEDYFAELPSIARTKKLQYRKNWFLYLFPRTQDKNYTISRLEENLNKIVDNELFYKKLIMQKIDDEERVRDALVLQEMDRFKQCC